MRERTRHDRGFTLIELCASLTMMVLVFTTVGFLLHRSVEGTAKSVGYAGDLRELRSAMRSLDEDLRRAEDVTVDQGILQVRSALGVVTYRTDEFGLRRVEGQATRSWRIVRAFRCERVEDLVRFELELRPRAAPAAKGPRVVASAVSLRRQR